MTDYNTDNMIAIANDNVIQAREFWNAKVYKIIQNFEYGRITMESLVDELALMGYEKEQVWALIAVELYEDTPYEDALNKFENMVDKAVLV